MEEHFSTNSMTISPGVIDRVIALAAEEVEEVAVVSSYVSGGLISQLISRARREAITVDITQDGKLNCKVHLFVYYGCDIPKTAEKVRQNIADEVLVQTGIEVENVDICVEGVEFKKQSA
jgi:uncharacterized alkaline shock family protein YloU